jgi:hypothetical protein
MAAYGKGNAMGYTDYFKNKTTGAQKKSTEDGAEEETDVTEMSPADKRKAAIKRRLMKSRKVGK